MACKPRLYLSPSSVVKEKAYQSLQGQMTFQAWLWALWFTALERVWVGPSRSSKTCCQTNLGHKTVHPERGTASRNNCDKSEQRMILPGFVLLSKVLVTLLSTLSDARAMLVPCDLGSTSLNEFSLWRGRKPLPCEMSMQLFSVDILPPCSRLW